MSTSRIASSAVDVRKVGSPVRRVDRDKVQAWLPLLDEWLLPGSFYGVHHTWPQLYRNDGHGAFFVITDGSRLLSHCACRVVTLRAPTATKRICLVGSVATDPEQRGQGLAQAVLQAAIEAHQDSADAFMLWAERPDLYARLGFAATDNDTCLLLARRPVAPMAGVRLAEIPDHEALRALHQQKPRRIERDALSMSALLTTPGMHTVVLERGGAIVAYACTGKGADLQGHWHEVGGTDEDLALLLPHAMHVADLVDSALLLPPYRPTLEERLGAHVVERLALPGPMIRPARIDGNSVAGSAAGAERLDANGWIDGLDSV
ncbi:MAG: GNAT family N-acetyltransferase [Planctomycetota bacterium]